MIEVTEQANRNVDLNSEASGIIDEILKGADYISQVVGELAEAPPEVVNIKQSFRWWMEHLCQFLNRSFAKTPNRRTRHECSYYAPDFLKIATPKSFN